MRFSEAVQKYLVEGEKIRNTKFHEDGVYITIDMEHSELTGGSKMVKYGPALYKHCRDGLLMPYVFTAADILSDDWEVVS